MDHQETLLYDLPNSSHLISDLHTGLESKNLANLSLLSCSLFMQNGTARRILERVLLLKSETSYSFSSLTSLICLVLLFSAPTIFLEPLILFSLHSFCSSSSFKYLPQDKHFCNLCYMGLTMLSLLLVRSFPFICFFQTWSLYTRDSISNNNSVQF